jgi:beta-lactam-binding protein with PASTA domain
MTQVMRSQSHRAMTLLITLVLAALLARAPMAGASHWARAATLPSVVGTKWQAAERKLGALGLRTVLQTVRSNRQVGIVVAQRPSARTVVQRGALVRLSVPAASRTTVPELLGRQTAAAQTRLHQSGLGSRVIHVKSLQAVGTVVAQSLKAGVEVALATRVSISISSGPGP